MSDYLWDKKGERDAEVARLETLLGAFAHEPRPLELPADVEPERPTAKLLPFASRLRASRLFAPALAAAAALVVASFLVASLFMRARVSGEAPRAAAQPPPPQETRKEERAMSEPPPREGDVKDEAPADVGRVKDKRAAVETLPRVARRRSDVQVASSRQPKLKDVAGAEQGFTLEAMATQKGVSTLVDSTRMMTKEQLVYALRLTSAKLKDMRERAQKAEARP
jgi:hypothetical protein